MITPGATTVGPASNAGEWRPLARYAVANMGKNALSSMMEVYALFYLTGTLGIAPQYAGLIIFTSLAWDAIIDPAIGIWADRQLQRRRATISRLLLLGTPLAALAFLAFFGLHLVAPSLRVAGAVVALIAFRAAYTLVDVPHNSLLVFAVSDFTGRARLASLRIFFSAAGKVALTATAAWMIGGDGANGPSFAITALVMVVIFLATLALCARAVANVMVPIRDAERQRWMPISALWQFLRCDPKLRLAFWLTALNSLTIPAIALAILFGAQHGLGDTKIGALILVAQAAMQALMPLIWDVVAQRFRRAIQLLAIAYAVLIAIVGLTIVVPVSVSGLFVLAIGSGSCIAGIFMLNWAFFAEALADGCVRSRSEMTLSVLGLYSVVNKLCHGISQLITGALIAFAARNDANIHQLLLQLVLMGTGISLIVSLRSREHA